MNVTKIPIVHKDIVYIESAITAVVYIKLQTEDERKAFKNALNVVGS
jgi:hypothetical protein